MSSEIVKGYAIVDRVHEEGQWFLSHYATESREQPIWTQDFEDAYVYLTRKAAKRAAEKTFKLGDNDYGVVLLLMEDKRDNRSPKQYGFITVADAE